MTDYFTLLGEPRRPWLDPDSLKQKFLARAANIHPDRVHNADELIKTAANRHYAELNTAYHCLADPKSRLLHLLELELGAKPKDIQQIPPELVDLFTEVAAACRNTDNFLANKRKVTSPLLQVRLFEQAQERVEPLRTLQTTLAGLQDNLIEELKSLDASWVSPTGERTVLLNRLEELYRLFGYFNRWSGQIQERIVQLSL
ncbi:MAG: J domain-containing protein [Limisphaerales bacterium]